ncbi:hypothetical protein [Halalkalicoccus sp. NIPERK01]|uniref:hypothetical protein n=1 Tax=Halalkalicoccus sp. NIPERK01 TaxID=3053469 RepID=UPI00256EEDD1|nr:hypothetical protein [Halalkalicoccus sp. NIPERK01]MDL5362095.1 hypothetical protein [Halalkalicoccus sp. NIPERK01]
MTHFTTHIDPIRKPEYTGENRCTLCTVANVLMAVAASALLALASPLLGVGTLPVFLGLIYARGYLVPETPRLTKRYFPDWLLQRFEKGTTSIADDGAVVPGVSIDPEVVLLAADAIEECESGDDHRLTDGFRAAWLRRIERLRGTADSPRELARSFVSPSEEPTVIRYGDAFTVAVDGERVGRWESLAVALADAAAAAELHERSEGWRTMSAPERSTVLRGLRVFLDRCPACDGPITASKRTVESCCRSRTVLGVGCSGCDVRLLEFDPTTVRS